MKKTIKIFLLLPLLLSGPLLRGQSWPTVPGDYFIYETTAKGFLSAGNEWGTRISIMTEGEAFTINKESSKYTLTANFLDTEKNVESNLYCGNNTPAAWTFTETSDGDGTYYIGNDAGYLTAVALESAVGQSTDKTKAAKFKFLTAAEAIGLLDPATASESNPINATFLIRDPNFSRNHSSAGWTINAYNKNMSGGDVHNCCAESWRSAFDISQTLTVPNGIYRLKAQAALTDYADAYDHVNYPVLYANESTVDFENMDTGDRKTNMNVLSASFSAGKYWINTTAYVNDGTLKVGVRGTRVDTWSIFDSFRLEYLGPVSYETKYVTVGESGYATFYSSDGCLRKIKETDAEVFTVSDISVVEPASMSLVSINDRNILPGVGVIIKGTPGTTYTLQPLKEASIQSMILEGSDTEVSQDSAYDYYILGMVDGALMFGKYDSTKKLQANKAYYKVKKQ